MDGVHAGSLTLLACALAAVGVRFLLLYDLMTLLALAVQGLTEASGAYDSVAWIYRVVHLVVPLLGSGACTSPWPVSTCSPTPATTPAGAT